MPKSPEKFPSEESPEEEKIQEEIAYEKLLEKKALERQESALKQALKKERAFVEAHGDIKKEIEQLVEGREEISAKGPVKKALEEIKSREKDIENEVLELVGTQENVKEIQDASKKRLWQFMRKRKKILKVLEKSEGKLEEFRKDIFKKPPQEFPSEIFEEVKDWEHDNEDLEEYLAKISQENPEAFMAYWLLKLREYQEQLPSGIVETPFVKEQKERAKDVLTKNKLIALVGETGTGKTRLARKIAEEISKKYRFVGGFAFMQKEDLFGRLGIAYEKVKAESVPKQQEMAVKRLRESSYYQELSPEERKEAEETVKNIVAGQAEQKEMVTKVFLAPVLKAAKEGRIVIIDEFNYIPSNLLAGLNALVDRNIDKAREEFGIMEEEIEVKEGFGVIFTGNITRPEFEGRYLKREQLDPALVNRLNAGLIEYRTIPQDLSTSFEESILERKEVEEGKEIPSRELFQIGLTLIVDKKGRLSAPADTLKKLWDLSREFSLFQKLFAREKIPEEVARPEEGISYQLEKYPISMRTFRSVIEGWREDGFRYSLDWYIYDHLLRPAFTFAPSEAAQMFYELRERGEFFRDPVWDRVKVDVSTWKIEGLEEIDRERKKVMKELEVKEEKHIFSPKEIAEAASGVKTPPLKTEEFKKEELKREQLEKYREMLEKVEEIEKFVEDWQESVELFCEDEQKIESGDFVEFAEEEKK